MRGKALAVVVVVALAAPAAAAEAPRIRVHVVAGALDAAAPEQRKAREKAADAERKRLERARKDLDKSLQARHGKRFEAWPEEARRASEAAWAEELGASLAHSRTKLDAGDLEDSAGDLQKALADELKKTPTVALATGPADADLTVEVLSRASRTSFPAAAWLLYLKVTPRSAGRSFAGVPFEQVKSRNAYLGQILGSQNLRGSIATIHAWTEAEPYWTIQVFQQGTGWKQVAWTAAEVLAAFAADLAEADPPPAPAT